MKRIIYILLFCVFNLSLAKAQSSWFNVTPPINDLLLNRIQFTSENTGFAIGPMISLSSGYLLKTTNAGTNWQSIFIDFAWVWSLFFIDNNTGYIAGSNSSDGVLAKTTNGGIYWSLQNTGIGTALLTVFFIDNNTGFVGGKYNYVAKTTNGGNNWIYKPGALGQEFNDIYFIDANTGFIIGNSNTINKTTNGGDNWIQLNYGSPYNYTSIHFLNNSTGYICTQTSSDSSIVYKTTNTGENWIYLSNIPTVLSSIFFPNLNTGYTTGGKKIFKTSNGGLNWTSQMPDSNANSNWRTVCFINDNTGFIAGAHGLIMKTTDGGNVFINNISNNIPNKFYLFQNYPNPFNPVTKIRFEIPSDIKSQTQDGYFPLRRGVGGMTTLKIFDMLGREVTTLVNEQLAPGTYEVTFDGSNIASGIYYYKLKAGDYIETKKMLIIK
jgi:photosystem II stability/assembly factor-like uncharacterized protein